ncbi:flagellar filament capping protein FliD [Butyrivibrio sp. AE2032]|uniref:flagellar filament capping protein FliD n=1 Tax=Butyrivibrio sp. AE2032 TaxID=1458463 RepID=UPI000554FAA5|nr:flagellar filament capping protein FliD [Butyrivibrio sp. AE2032]
MAGISLNGAYNHFIQDYVSKDVTQADAHRKEELRDVYKSIAKINKKSPLYLLTDDDTSRNDAIDIKEKARQLQGSIRRLSDHEDKSSLNHTSAFTTDDDKVVASYIGKTPDQDIGNAQFDIEVTQLASSQVNKGAFLPKDAAGLSADNYAFDVRINGQEFEFQFSVYGTDKNKDVQDKLEKLINKANIGLHAEVVEDGDRSALEISSTHTGLRPGQVSQFEIFESSSGLAGGAIKYLGIDHVAAPATNAHFSLNGEDRVAVSNHFTVGGKFDITLKETTIAASPIHVGVKKDNEALLKHVTSLIDNYNNFITDAAGKTDDKFKGSKLRSEIIGIAQQNLSDCEDLGIKLEGNGTLSIDDEMLRQAVSAGNSMAALEPVNKFADALIDKTKDISVDPMKYIDRPVVNYKNPDSRDYSSPYITSEYSGMMFNNYC